MFLVLKVQDLIRLYTQMFNCKFMRCAIFHFSRQCQIISGVVVLIYTATNCADLVVPHLYWCYTTACLVP
jgi:hypothetical protein